MKLRELGEDRLIAQLVARLKSRPDVIAGPGDDCAVLRRTGTGPFPSAENRLRGRGRTFSA